MIVIIMMMIVMGLGMHNVLTFSYCRRGCRENPQAPSQSLVVAPLVTLLTTTTCISCPPVYARQAMQSQDDPEVDHKQSERLGFLSRLFVVLAMGLAPFTVRLGSVDIRLVSFHRINDAVWKPVLLTKIVHLSRNSEGTLQYVVHAWWQADRADDGDKLRMRDQDVHDLELVHVLE